MKTFLEKKSQTTYTNFSDSLSRKFQKLNLIFPSQKTDERILVEQICDYFENVEGIEVLQEDEVLKLDFNCEVSRIPLSLDIYYKSSPISIVLIYELGKISSEKALLDLIFIICNLMSFNHVYLNASIQEGDDRFETKGKEVLRHEFNYRQSYTRRYLKLNVHNYVIDKEKIAYSMFYLFNYLTFTITQLNNIFEFILENDEESSRFKAEETDKKYQNWIDLLNTETIRIWKDSKALIFQKYKSLEEKTSSDKL
jgi:hypothetical protein